MWVSWIQPYIMPTTHVIFLLLLVSDNCCYILLFIATTAAVATITGPSLSGNRNTNSNSKISRNGHSRSKRTNSYFAVSRQWLMTS